ncbi:Triosephosphate isomerase [Candidatus Arsenophonus lipoptenae]|uniref:Triosephosphate isomerase n=1 Tax=Candidatus Arsenophonus lipoptenae TaxID=634113 RepID=A0A0X9VED4_9GAMM|nr:triose-phosphate isomerase [Candidatus Arsenophonus lipoptenae]AMA64974.1 Triosephosphate isomerase [Candidatus Arsenophonus lipoptenae]
MHYPLIIGNWKLNGNTKIIEEFVQILHKKLNNITKCNIVIAPPTIYLSQVKKALTGSNIELSAQDVDINISGAFTGETSAEMLKDIGVKYTIIGHSERRIHHKETNEQISKKFLILKSKELIPILCIGDTQEEYNSGKTEKVCINQIDIILNKLGIHAFKNTVIAYEPIWAIGSGKSASPTHAQAVHKHIRNYLAKENYSIAKQVIIQYGGSVNANNAAEFFIQPDIDGVLVGSASLNLDSFMSIIYAALKKYNY